MEPRGLVAAVAAALPGEHRSAQARGAGGRPRLREPPQAIAKHPVGDLGEPQAQPGQHEQLVPEHMSPVRLAVQATCGHADVEVGGVR